MNNSIKHDEMISILNKKFVCIGYAGGEDGDFHDFKIPLKCNNHCSVILATNYLVFNDEISLNFIQILPGGGRRIYDLENIINDFSDDARDFFLFNLDLFCSKG